MSETQQDRAAMAKASVAVNDLLDEHTADEKVAITALCTALAMRCANNADNVADLLLGLATMHQAVCTSALNFYEARTEGEAA